MEGPGATAEGTATGRVGSSGTVTTTAVEELLRVARQLVPNLHQVGLLYNPAEPNSSFEAELLAQAVAIALHSLEADPDVGLDVLHHVPDVEGRIGVGQGGGD